MFQNLKEAVSRIDDSLLSVIDEMIDICAFYVQRVANMENALESAYFRLEGADYREFITELDRSRKVVHDDLIGKVSMSIRLAKKVSVEHPFNGDIGNRHQVADFAKEVSDHYFKNGIRVKS